MQRSLHTAHQYLVPGILLGDAPEVLTLSHGAEA
jgi:hypothetical protein